MFNFINLNGLLFLIFNNIVIFFGDMKVIIRRVRKKLNRILVFLFALYCFSSCKSQNKKRGSWENKNFEIYLTNNKIAYKKQENGFLYNDSKESIYDKYYSDFLKYEKKQELEKNPYLKINKVYVRFRTPTSVEFSIYSDRGTFCINSFDLDIDGKVLSFPENGKIKILEPIKIEHFGDFEIANNILKTRKRRISPFNETYYYVNGTIKNDTIHFTEAFIGKEKKFEKKIFAKKHDEDFKEVYQPDLKAEQYKIGKTLVSYEVTGEFSVKE